MSEYLKQGLIDLSHDVEVVDMRDRVLRGSRRIARRNAVLGSLTVVAVLAGTAAAFGAVQLAPPAPPLDTLFPTPAGSVEPSPSPGATRSPAVDVGDVRNAVFQVPAFPGAAETCPGGERRFQDGKSRIGADATLVIQDRPPVVADIDGQPGDEVLIHITCDGVYGEKYKQLLAMRVDAAARLHPIGFVLPKPVDPDFHDAVRVTDRVIQVPISSSDDRALDRQVRGYALQGNVFKQVSGPTTVPPVERDVRAIDWSAATFGVSFTHEDHYFSGYAKVAGGSGEAALGQYRPQEPTRMPKWLGAKVFNTDLDGVALVTNSNSWDPNGSACLLVTMQSADGFRVQGVYVYQRELEGPASPAYGEQLLLQTGKDGVTAIEKIEGSGNTLTVTLRIGSAQEKWSYRHTRDRGWARAD